MTKRQFLTCEATAEILYFQANEQGTAYALTDRAVYPSFHPQLGARASFSWQTPHDEWTFQLQALHFHARSTDTLTQSAFATWSHPAFTQDALSLCTHSRWRLHLGWVDLTLARPFRLIVPYFGFKFAGVRQKSRIHYLYPLGEEELSMKNKFFGIGPEIGLLLQLPWTEHLRAFVRGTVSLLCGYFYLHQDEDHSQTQNRMKILSRFYLPREILESAIGLSYSHCFGAFAWELRASYELSLLQGQNLAIQFHDARTPGQFSNNLGDLTLQGWTLGLACHF